MLGAARGSGELAAAKELATAAPSLIPKSCKAQGFSPESQSFQQCVFSICLSDVCRRTSFTTTTSSFRTQKTDVFRFKSRGAEDPRKCHVAKCTPIENGQADTELCEALCDSLADSASGTCHRGNLSANLTSTNFFR